MSDFIFEHLAGIMRDAHTLELAITGLIMASLADQPDGRDKIQAATDSARELYNKIDKRKNKHSAEIYRRTYLIGESVLNILDHAVEGNKIEWPMEKNK